jgi:transposase
MSTLRKRHRARSSPGAARPFAGMRQGNPPAAGVDIGAHESVVWVPDGDDQQIVRTFGTYPADRQPRADCLVDRGIQTVAMESPGVYWLPLFEARAARGLPCCLRSAQSIPRVPGRKSAGLDCQWMQTLHSSGFLAASLRPAADCVALRPLVRQRAQLLQHRAPHGRHLPQALLQMHSQVSHALREVTGDTGPRMIRAIVAGERAPRPLAAWRHSRGKKDAAEIAWALTGTWRAAHLLVLTPALALFDFSTAPLHAGDAQSARTFAVMKPRFEPVSTRCAPAEAPRPPRRKPHAHRKHAPAGTSRAPILRSTGVALVAGHGLSDAMAQTLLAESGTAMSQGPTEKHFGAWRGLAPKKDSSGGTVRKSRTMNKRHRAAQAFRRAAHAVIRSHCALGAFSRRLQGRLGPAQALVAPAHKSARTVSHLRKERVPYHDIGATAYNTRFRERELKDVQKKAAKLGYTLSPA